MRIIFLGAPGVGKGTQAALLCMKRGWAHISTGNLLRDAVDRGTPVGKRAQAIMERGDLVEDDVILALLEETLQRTTGGFVLDGFPRTLGQAVKLDDLLDKRGERLDRVLLLSAGEEEVMSRMQKRGRADDGPDAVRNRLRVYEEKTAPLVDYYDKRGLLARINGMGDIEEIRRRIVRAVGPESEG